MLKSSLGVGFAAVTGVACGNQDAEVFAGAVADAAAPTTSSTAASTTAPTTSTTTQTTSSSADPTTSSAPTTDAGAAEVLGPAVAGEMVIGYTYTRVGEGKIEPPYVAVWIEDSAGDLLHTIHLEFDQRRRRGARWLDHLDRWFAVDTARIADGGPAQAATISSATRPPGSYAVAWDGLIDGAVVPAGDYYICIESAREDGPYSLIREPFTLTGSLAETALPDDGELSMATVRIDV